MGVSVALRAAKMVAPHIELTKAPPHRRAHGGEQHRRRIRDVDTEGHANEQCVAAYEHRGPLPSDPLYQVIAGNTKDWQCVHGLTALLSGAVHALEQIIVTAENSYTVYGEFSAPTAVGTWPAFW